MGPTPVWHHPSSGFALNWVAVSYKFQYGSLRQKIILEVKGNEISLQPTFFVGKDSLVHCKIFNNTQTSTHRTPVVLLATMDNQNILHELPNGPWMVNPLSCSKSHLKIPCFPFDPTYTPLATCYMIFKTKARSLEFQYSMPMSHS